MGKVNHLGFLVTFSVVLEEISSERQARKCLAEKGRERLNERYYLLGSYYTYCGSGSWKCLIHLFNKVVIANVRSGFEWAVQDSDLPRAQRCHLETD